MPLCFVESSVVADLRLILETLHAGNTALLVVTKSPLVVTTYTWHTEDGAWEEETRK